MDNPVFSATGTLQADGLTVQLDHKAALPPGRVLVTVQPCEIPARRDIGELFARIDRMRRESGRPLRTEEEMEAELAAQRAEDEAYDRKFELLYAQIEAEKANKEMP